MHRKVNRDSKLNFFEGFYDCLIKAVIFVIAMLFANFALAQNTPTLSFAASIDGTCGGTDAGGYTLNCSGSGNVYSLQGTTNTITFANFPAGTYSISFQYGLYPTSAAPSGPPAGSILPRKFDGNTPAGSFINPTMSPTSIAGGAWSTYSYSPFVITSPSATANKIVINTGGAKILLANISIIALPPVASAVSQTVAYNSSANSITLSATNTPTSVAVSANPSHGTATASGTAITYTPTTGYYGADSFQYTATNAGGTSSPATATITISPPTLLASPIAGALTTGTVGTAYSSVTLSTSGGANPYTYAVTTGSLPAGLSLSAGVISGTPTAAGTSNFTITATDSSTLTHATLSTNYSIAVALATQATLNASASPSNINTNATSTVSTTGGSGGGAVSYAVTSGSCTISGTTVTAGTLAETCTVTATKAADSTYAAASATVNITVSIPTPVLTFATPSSATVAMGASLTNAVTSTLSGGSYGAISYSSATPAVATVNSSGVITPVSVGTSVITATQAAVVGVNAQATQTYTVTVNPTPVPTLTFATQNSASVTLSGSLTNAATSTIPSGGGISYTSSNTAVATVNNAGVITTVAAGTSTITATQAAAAGINTLATATYTITVNALLTPTLTFATPTSASVALGGALTNAATSTNSGGSFGAISYSSSNTSVATVNASGAITTIASGTAVITATQAAVAGVNALATQTYTLTVQSTNAALSNLAISSGTLSPVFSGGTNSYTVSVGNATSSITVTPTVAQSNATIKVNGTTVASGAASGSINLNVGSNTITTVVTAQDGTTSQTYTTTVTRAAAASTDATLSALTLSSGTLSPTFASGTTSYTASVANSVSSITVTPTRNQANATITVNGTAVTSGSASGAISLSVGSNTITTVVTAQDGTTTQTYTTTVTRAAALLMQASFTVVASPSTLNATITTSTLSTSGGSGTGVVSYAMTAGTCTLSGTTVTAGTAAETCTVTATKAADSTYLAATATVNITVARRASIAAAATDSSVATVHGAQLLQAQKFATTQVQNITSHLDTFRHNFNLQPSNFGFGINGPSLGQLAPVFYKIKDELTYRADDQQDRGMQKIGYRQTGYPSKQVASLMDDFNDPDQLEQPSQPEAQRGQYVREPLSYSIWTAGTIDAGTFKSGDNKETTNKFSANGLTMGIDYKLSHTVIIGGAIGYGNGRNSADTQSNNVKSTQKTLTGYGMWGFGDSWVVDGLFGYGDLAFTGDRTTSDGSATLTMNRKGTSSFGSTSISKIFRVGGFKVSPFVREDLLRINLGQYTETGAADYALGYDKTSYLTTTVSSGLHLAYDVYFDSGKLTTSAKISGNRARTGSLNQDIYFADSGAAGGVYTLQQAASFQNSTSLHLGLMYTGKGGDVVDIGWMGAVGANQYKLNGLRFGVRFAM